MFILKSINYIKNIFLDLLFPKFCEKCGKEGSYLCPKCGHHEIKINLNNTCHVCKKPIKNSFVHNLCKKKTNLEGVFVMTKYTKFLEKYIGDIKFEFYYQMIDDLMPFLYEYIEKNQEIKNIILNSTIICVPLHRFRMNWRGFNQAEIIARKIAEKYGLKYENLIKKVKRTKTQVGLSRKQRLFNLKNVFEINSPIEKLNQIVIVDDVMTTGTTLEECAKVLKKGGVEKVWGLVVARG